MEITLAAKTRSARTDAMRNVDIRTSGGNKKWTPARSGVHQQKETAPTPAGRSHQPLLQAVAVSLITDKRTPTSIFEYANLSSRLS
jgi:hypothetical protein